MIKLRNKFQFYTLQSRIMAMHLVTLLVPIVLIGGISYYSITLVQQNKIERGVQTHLNEVRNKLENVLDNIGYVSKQLAFDGDIGQRMERYLNPNTPSLDKINIKNDIESRLSLLTYSNPSIGTMFYYIPGNQSIPDNQRILFSTLLVKTDADPLANPVLARDYRRILYGPHKSMYKYSDPLVFSVMEKLESISGIPESYIYIETNYKVLQTLFSNSEYGYPTCSLILDGDGKVMYTSNPDMVQIGERINPNSERIGEGADRMQLFVAPGSGDLYVAELISLKELNREQFLWTIRFAIISSLSILICLLLSWRLWKIIADKLNLFKREIMLLGNYQFDRPLTLIHVLEFDDLIKKFYTMRERIMELVSEVEEKERNKRRLEVEKLKHQINPHFIHNTLNTIQWIARINRQDEIVKLVSIFTRILHYNLGKDGEIVTVREELNALNDYIALQQIRYDHRFQVVLDADEDTLDLCIVRFLIQPIVENAMYHAFQESDGTITVRLYGDDDSHFFIEVKDDGIGMSAATVEQLLEREEGERKTGLGIGLRFVNRTVKQYFGEEYGLEIRSEQGKGTVISLRIPATQALRRTGGGGGQSTADPLD
ncbi:sensor histidine kinase [Paenibacillus gansuensis]|uniref:histidine kinase n=1 Tax=Paenibacillus gansuensis TaxID=306542 RepID=A0ABW5PGK1_9BACL